MSTTLHTFMDIFETTIFDGETAVQLNKIAIPIIQRDYAQGRIDPDVNRVRSRFLYSLYNAITGDPVTLDFGYGDIDEKGTMIDSCITRGVTFQDYNQEVNKKREVATFSFWER